MALLERSDFLKNHWQSYPAVREGFEIIGRIEKISSQKVALQKKGEWGLHSQVQFIGLKNQGGSAVEKSQAQKPDSQNTNRDLGRFYHLTEPGPIELSGADQIASVLLRGDWVSIKLSSDNLVESLQLLAPQFIKPLELKSSPEIQRKWFQFLGKSREFFVAKGFDQAQTPTLVECPGTEPFLDLFSTQFQSASRCKKLYLPTSPELHLKKMLSAGYENIFEIRSCFRNGEISQNHQPEFWMLEWYRQAVGLDQIIQDVLHLIEFLGGEVQQFRRVTMAALFKEYLDFDLTPQTSIEELKSLARTRGLNADADQLWDDVFYLLFVDQIEAKIDSFYPVFVEKYPPSQAALARLTEDGWGDRFELYWKGREIANAFHELNDPQIQLHRFYEDLHKKSELGKEVPPLDEEFLQALQSGMPPSSGIALGLERLFMALYDIQDIQELRPFPFS